MPVWGSVYFQNSVSSVMEQLIFFHDHTMMIMIMIMILVGYMLLSSCFGKFYNLMMFEGQELEMIWTLLPAVFLLFIAFPSLRLLYLMEEFEEYDMTIKLLGHQWYWSYEYSDLEVKFFDSYMMSGDETNRLLSVDNVVLIPYGINTRLLLSSTDVIHSWTIPALGIKADAVPGRLNQLCLEFNRMGLFSGQCSEICGSNHSFMPVVILVTHLIDFINKIN